MFHEALLTSEQPAWTAARGVPLRALFGAAAVGACIGWTIAVLPAASDGLYQRVTNLEDVAPNPNGWFYSETPGGGSDGAVQRKSWAAAGYPICGEGRAQSPIDIDTRHGNGPNPAIAGVLDHSMNSSLPAVSLTPQTGHNFQLTMPADAPAMAAGYGTWLRGERFGFAQAHWHTPSENTIDGVHSILEGHFVHKLEGGTALAVLAVLFELTDECDNDLAQFWDAFPLELGTAAPLKTVTAASLSTAFIKPLLKTGYYHWSGSLTTPPCSEAVDWALFKGRLPVCQAQVDRLKTALAHTQAGVDINNRVTQPLHQRVITQTTY